MKVLLVEDDYNKERNICDVLTSDGILAESELTIARSYQEGLRHLLSVSFDLVLMDMSVPTFSKPGDEAGPFRHFGGKELLRELQRKERDTKVLIVTQFESFEIGNTSRTLESVSSELKRDFGNLFEGLVYYSAAQTQWRGEIVAAVLRSRR